MGRIRNEFASENAVQGVDERVGRIGRHKRVMSNARPAADGPVLPDADILRLTKEIREALMLGKWWLAALLLEAVKKAGQPTYFGDGKKLNEEEADATARKVTMWIQDYRSWTVAERALESGYRDAHRPEEPAEERRF